jgi:hypothetical protein
MANGHGGRREGAGRPKGSRDRGVIERLKLAEKGREALLMDHRLPLEIMLARMAGDPTITDEMFQAAIASAPYIHPRLSSSDTTVRSDNVHRLISDEPMTPAEWTTKYAANANTPLAADDRAATDDGSRMVHGSRAAQEQRAE